MRRIRQGVATEAYWASTVRERNEAGADAAGLECNRIYETQHLGSPAAGQTGGTPGTPLCLGGRGSVV